MCNDLIPLIVIALVIVVIGFIHLFRHDGGWEDPL
jgi:hypothetical protein